MKTIAIDGLYAQKIADICEVPVEYVCKLRDKELLNEKLARDTLVRHDFYALYKTGKLDEKAIYDRLSVIYNVSPQYISQIIKMKRKRIFYCKRCGKVISKSAYTHNDGMCGYCLSRKML